MCRKKENGPKLRFSQIFSSFCSDCKRNAARRHFFISCSTDMMLKNLRKKKIYKRNHFSDWEILKLYRTQINNLVRKMPKIKGSCLYFYKYVSKNHFCSWIVWSLGDFKKKNKPFSTYDDCFWSLLVTFVPSCWGPDTIQL